MASGKNKQYGLIVPSKGTAASTSTKKNVFGDDSDSDSDDGGDWVKKSLKREAQKSVLKRTTKIQMQKALEEDPTVFQYDEVYDDLEQKKEEAKATKKGVEKKPRYIQALLQTAEKRKKENERRIERQVQKEREEEGEQFADKESFVTSSYRQKLEEFKKQEEEEKRMERLEAIGDVTKQKDLTGFYRHLYRQTMGESLPGASDNIKPEEIDALSDGKEIEENSKTASTDPKEHPAGAKRDDHKKDRQYRKRRSSSSSISNSDQEDKNDVKKEKNVDTDSDFTGSSSSTSSSSVTGSGSEEGEITKKKKTSHKLNDKEKQMQKKKRKMDVDDKNNDINTSTSPAREEPVANVVVKEEEPSPDIKNKDASDNKNLVNISKKESDESKEEKVLKPKVDVWAKRTVGQALDDAVQRYYERKAARVSLRMGRA